ncbi:hypothetical protein WK07_03730 [Burkholderia multivorans]|nr:hypothetical protein WK07_03730 [Burkholderia multivorans]
MLKREKNAHRPDVADPTTGSRSAQAPTLHAGRRADLIPHFIPVPCVWRIARRHDRVYSPPRVDFTCRAWRRL